MSSLTGTLDWTLHIYSTTVSVVGEYQTLLKLSQNFAQTNIMAFDFTWVQRSELLVLTFSSYKNMQTTGVSAGGVIVKKEGDSYSILLLRDTRFPEWYFAKGHVEPGETLEQAALREVGEEAGLHQLKIHFHLGSYERFVEKANELKTIHYFLMSPTQEEVPTSPDNDHVELKWFPLELLPAMYLPEQKDVVEKHLTKIKNSLNKTVFQR